MGCAASLSSCFASSSCLPCHRASSTDFLLPTSFQPSDHLSQLIARWQLTHAELDHFYRRFVALDANQNGTIEADEFFGFLNEPRTRRHIALYHLIVPESEVLALDFDRWLALIFSFAFLTHHELYQAVFACYDTLREGALSVADVQILLRALHGDNILASTNLVDLMTARLQAAQGKLEFDEFTRCCDHYPILLWPVRQVQEMMRERVIGLKMFASLDARTNDVERVDARKHHVRQVWKKRYDTFVLYCCSFPCVPCCVVHIEEKDGVEVSAELLAKQAALKSKRKKKAGGQEEKKMIMGDLKDEQALEALMNALYESESEEEIEDYTDANFNEYDDEAFI